LEASRYENVRALDISKGMVTTLENLRRVFEG
jgi:hypothetical protein